MATNINITTTPTLLVSAKVARLRGWFLLEVAAGATKVYVSQNPAVTPATGFALESNTSSACTLFASGKPALGAWYGVTADGTASVKVEEGAGAAVGTGTDSMLAIYRPPASGASVPAGNVIVDFNDDETAVIFKRADNTVVGEGPIHEYSP